MIFTAAYFVLIGSTYYEQIFAVRVFTHLFTTVLLSLWLGPRLIRRRGLPPTPLNKLLYLCIGVWLLSAVFSLDPRMALENLWFPITTLLMFFVVVDFLQTGEEKRLIEVQFLIAALVVILAGIELGSWLFGWGFATPTVGWASLLGKDLLLPAAPPRLFVPLGVSTWLAAYTAPLAIIVGAWAFTTLKRAPRNFLWLLALLLVVIMLFTGSRGGWISLGAGIAVFLGLQLLRNQRLQQWVRRRAIPVLMGVALVIAGAVFALIRIGNDPRHAAGDFLRFDLWRGALQIVHDHPFLGIGPGLFGTAYRLYRDPSVYLDNRLSVAHNFYLNSLAENGILGGLVILALGFVLLRAWWKLWRAAETPSRRIHLEGALAALIGFGVQSFFDTFTSLPLVLLALGLTAYCVTQTRSRLEPVLKGSIPAALIALGIVVVYGVGLVRSDQAQAAFNAGVKGSLAQAQQALALDPNLHLYDLQVAYEMGLGSDLTEAIPAYQRALQLEPTWDTGWINLAALFVRQNNTAQALSALQKAANIDYHNGAWMLWAQLAEQTGAAPADTIRDAYLHYLNSFAPGELPLSSYWSQTDLRKQALAVYEQEVTPDLRYRVVEAQDPGTLAKLVPAAPSSAGDWWVVGQYALDVEKNAAKADQAFTQTINLSRDDTYLGDYYVSRARARVTTDPSGALRDLNIGELIGTFNESPNAVRALLAPSADDQRRLLAAAVPPQIIDQNFEGVLFDGRVAAFELLAEMRLPGPGRPVLQPWYDLAQSYMTAGQTDQAVNVYRAILARAPEESAAQTQLDQLAGK